MNWSIFKAIKLNKMKKAPISVRIINFLTQLAFWLLILVVGVSFIANILIEAGALSDNDFQLRVELPVTFDVSETGTVVLYGETNEVRIEEAQGKIHIIDTPISFAKVVLRLAFTVSLLALYMAWKFKSFIQNIKVGEIFNTENINNLKHIAYALLILWLMTKVYMTILFKAVIQYAQFSTIHFNTQVFEGKLMLVAAMLLWILAHVFMKGVEMKEEQELTI